MKAQIHTVEAVIAVAIMVTTLIVFSHRAQPMKKLSMLNYKLEAYNALNLLDKTGQLRKDVINNNVKSLEEKLKPFIKYSFSVVVFNKTAALDPLPSVPANEMIVSCYYIAGEVWKYEPRKVCVYEWGVSS